MYKKYLITFIFITLNSFQTLALLKGNKLDAKSLNESKEKNFKENLKTKTDFNNSKILLIDTLPLLAENIEKNILDKTSDEIEISSDTQFQNKEFLTAEGNVVVNKGKMILKANKLKYNKIDKTLLIDGDIYFKSDDQFIKSTKIEYDIKNKKGFIKDAYGSLNFNTLNNIFSNPKSNK